MTAAMTGAVTPTLLCDGARVVVDGATAIDALCLRAAGQRVLIAGDYLPLLRSLTAGATAVTGPGTARVATGRIELAGKDVAAGEHFAVVGFALADAPLAPRWTAAQYLAWSARLAGVRSRKARALGEAALSRIGAGELAVRPLRSLSAVQRRLLLLAAAIVADPEVVVVEDPLRGIEPRAAPAVMFALSAVTSGRAAILFLPRLDLHGQQGELARTATHVALLRGGELLFEGDCGAFFAGASLFAITVSRNAEALAEQLKEAGATVAGGPLHFSVALPASLTARDIVSAAAKAKASVLSCLPLG